jgi:hypothetical protein
MLTVTSGMDPQMICVNLGRFGLIGLVPLARSILCSGLCGVIDVPLSRYWSFAWITRSFQYKSTPLLSVSQTESAILTIAFKSCFPTLVE